MSEHDVGRSPASRYWLTALRGAAVVALFASAALFAHYLAPAESGYCSARSGCEAVRQSTLGAWGNTYFNMPVLGLLAYLSILGLSLIPDRRDILIIAAALGGFCGVALVLVQTLLVGTLCWLCAIVDAAAIGVAYAALSLRHAGPQASVLRARTWACLSAIAVAAPLLWPAVKSQAEAPRAITALYQPGVLNVVEFADFQCPHCRSLHPLLTQQLDQTSNVKLRRVIVPLPNHELAEGAARAFLCAELAGQGEGMARLLFEKPLVFRVWHEHAKALGLEPAQFEKCLAARATTQQLSDNIDLFNAARLSGLPTTFVGHLKFVGTPNEEQLSKAFVKARTGVPWSLPGWAFASISLGALLACIWWDRRTLTRN